LGIFLGHVRTLKIPERQLINSHTDEIYRQYCPNEIIYHQLILASLVVKRITMA